MSVGALGSISAVQARAVELQGYIDSITPTRVTGAAETTSSATAGSVFGSALTQALTGSGNDAEGGLTVGGLSLSEFSSAQVTPGSGMEVLQRAMGYIGVPYVWGGSDPSGFDCSGLVYHVLGQMGVSMPRVAADQATVGTEVPSLDQALPGDLVVTRGGGHIGIYVGGGQMLHAPQPGDSVKISDIGGDIMTIRRVVPSGTVASASQDVSASMTEAALGRAILQALSSTQSSTSGYGGLSGLGSDLSLLTTGSYL